MSENQAVSSIDRPYLDFGNPAGDATQVQRLRAAEVELPPIPIRGSDYAELLGRDKHKGIAEARMVAYWLLRVLTRMSYPEIGCALNKDHTSAMNGVRRCLRRREDDRSFESFTDRLAVAVRARMGGA